MPQNNTHPFHTLTLATLFVVLIGYILYIGQNIILPILVAIIVVYVLVSASTWLGRQPVLRHLPETIRRIIVLASFSLVLIMLGGIVVATAEKITPQLPTYQHNVENLIHSTLAYFHIEEMPNWSVLWERLTDHINLQSILTSTMSALSSMAGWVFMVILYAGFLIAERGNFAEKLTTALPGDRGRHASDIVHNINKSIGDYLAIKTLINVLLGCTCFAILLLFGIDFAIFWAILIALFNYIPYIGSFIGVAFPVLLAMAQFGSIGKSALVLAALVITQMFVGNIVEPKLIGKKVNMSPFVVLVALTLWSSLWGIAGAILAIPLTAMITIILSSFKSTQPLAVLLAEDVHAIHSPRQHHD
ncbi:AI-2E family transporter [Cardiobacteriaceae bacterium TAE3-ERU3]|nr:AI-2E family transporter [Cardiobacteriaceae bacterium TAE3-ERU3]